jgi:hypothetical protein
MLLFAISSHAGLSAFINGQNYVPLADWARANDFRIALLNREIILTDKNSRLVFGVDSAQAEINGVNVRFSFGQDGSPAAVSLALR